jgi:hypothetical protein
MRRTTIKPKRLYELAREYMALRHVPVNPLGGRPREYDDALILTIACLQNLNQYSFREALEYCEDYFKELPALSTYHDRLALLTSDIAQGFVEYIGKKIKEIEPKKTSEKKGRLFIVDGTGFSYHDVYPLQLHRGTEIRKIQNHVKVGALIGFVGLKRYVVSVSAGQAYAGDTTLIQPLLEKLKDGKGNVLGDKGFDSHQIMATIKDKGYEPVIPIKRYRSCSPQDPLRIESNKNASNHRVYKQRTLIEGLFGNVKQKLSSHVKIFTLEIAKCFALLRFALLNISVLVGLEKAVIWIWFPNRASIDERN